MKKKKNQNTDGGEGRTQVKVGGDVGDGGD
jgi:hypothetical protein